VSAFFSFTSSQSLPCCVNAVSGAVSIKKNMIENSLI
jgi:hypothetical protein